MMIPDILGTIAEIIITMAGFMGVVVAFNRGWSESKEMYFRIQWTFAVALVALISLLLPHFLLGYSNNPEIVFGLPLAFMGLSYLVIVAFGLWQQASGKTTRTGSTLSLSLHLLLTISVTVLLLLSSLDVLIPRSGEMLILGSAWSVCIIASAFISSIRQGMNS